MAGTPNVGTLVGAAIRPINTADLISTAYANEIKGGIHGYATLSERDNIIMDSCLTRPTLWSAFYSLSGKQPDDIEQSFLDQL